MERIGLQDATTFGAPCIQLTQSAPAAVIGSEDCLYLNVWSPMTSEAALPVLVYLHGGDNVWGSATG